ncbi:hypothetical protein HWV62_8757 [Athelia sp. TMB]|nr:hypothetical protein HWV62_8757 [Athelia sp. TMB]
MGATNVRTRAPPPSETSPARENIHAYDRLITSLTEEAAFCVCMFGACQLAGLKRGAYAPCVAIVCYGHKPAAARKAKISTAVKLHLLLLPLAAHARYNALGLPSLLDNIDADTPPEFYPTHTALRALKTALHALDTPRTS